MGDVIHNLPIISDILAVHPNATIDWVVEEGFADILSFHPKIHRVLTVAIRRWRKRLLAKETHKEIRQAIAQLRQQPYDVIIDTQGLLKSVLIASFATGTKHGRDWASNREKFASLFYDQKHHVPYDQHTVDRNRQLTTKVLGLALPSQVLDYGLSPLNRKVDAPDLESVALPKSYVVFLHGTSRDSKLWPVERWQALGQHLNQLSLAVVLPWSNPAEQHRAEQIANALPDALILPKLSLKAMTIVCADAKAAIGVDTGLVHMATATNTPTIAIYTDSHPRWNGARAGQAAIAINLGGVANSPSTQQVIDAFGQLAIN